MKFPSILTKALSFARTFKVVLIAAVVMTPVFLEPGNAQQTPDDGIGSDQIQRILQGRAAGASDIGSDQSQRNQEIIIEPSAPSRTYLPPSRLEQMMSARAGAKLQQFGYDQFGIGRTVAIPQMGAVQDDYTLGPGDQIDVSLRGQENAEYHVTVDRSGEVLLPRLNPIAAAGRSFGDFRQALMAAVARAYVSTQAFVSINHLRQISVLVTGEVANPGERILTGLSTPEDAIVVSGGILKTGSLRAIRVIRSGRTFPVDLYGFITQHGTSSSIHLADGDRIVVPPLGKAVAATGWVRLPGIYELAPGTSAISTRSLTDLAGGFEVRGKYRLSVLRLLRDGRSQLANVGETGSIQDGEVLFVEPAASQTTSQAILSGGTALAGRYAVGEGTRLSDLIKSAGALGTSPYTLFGIIYRRDPATYLRTLVAFTPSAVLNGTEDMLIRSDDIVRVFSISEAQMMRNTMEKFQAHKQLVENAIRNPQSEQASPVGDTDFLNQLGTPDSSRTRSNQQTQQNELQNSQNQQNQNQQDQQNQPNQSNQQNMTDLQGRETGTSSSSSTAALAAAQQANQSSVNQRQEIANLGAQGDFSNGQANQPPMAPRAEVPPQNFQEQNVSGNEVATNVEAKTFGELARQVGVDPLVLANFLLDHAAMLRGAVRGPGLYLVGPHANLQDLITAAGGTTDWADESGVELISSEIDVASGKSLSHRDVLPLHQGTLANYVVKPHDEIRFNQTYTDVDAGTATVQGEFRFPGSYQISHGERLSSLVIRAGGLTPVAYPYGTVFLRRSAASLEADGYRRAADEIENAILAGMTRVSSNSSDRLTPDVFGPIQAFVRELRNQKPLGRITVVADPSVLLAKPELDPMLEPGDVIYVPQRPSTVAVLGQVLQPGSFQYRAGRSADDYLASAGGYAQFADESLMFIVLPNGTAEKVDKSWLNFSHQAIPPGSTIVVPRDLAPYELRQFIIDTSQIVSQLAISAASLAFLSSVH